MNSKIKWSNSISTNLLKWFLLLSLVPVLIISLLAYKNSSNSLYKVVSAELGHSASSYVDFIDNWFYYRQADITSWAEAQNSIDFMRALNEGLSVSTKNLDTYIKSISYITLIELYQNDMVELTRQYDYIYDLFLVDTKGNLLYSVAKEDDLGTNLVHGKYSESRFAQTYRQTLKDGKVHFSDLEEYAPSYGEVYGFITAPIIDDEGGLLGVYAIQIKYNRISKQFSLLNAEDNGISHYLLGGEDLKLRSSIDNEDEILHRRIQTPQTDLYQSEHVHKEIETHEEDIHFYMGPSQKEVIGKHHPVEIMGVKWVLISEMSKSKALESSYKLAYELFFITLALLMIIFFTALFVAKRLTKPILSLAQASEAITSGKERSPVWIDDENEIGQFADAFNDMIEELTLNEKILKQRSEEADAALVELEEQKLALDAHSIVAITDVKGHITYANDKFVDISGFSKEELLGEDHRMLNSGYHPTSFWNEMYHSIANKIIWHGEVKNRAKDGSFYWVETTIVPFLNDKGKVKSYIVIRTDITEQKEYSEKLIKAKEDAEQGARSKAEFLASMSHEIRTPMNGVLGMLGLLKNSQLSQTQGHQVSLAESSAQSLLTLINDILDFSKVEAGKLELEELEFNLRDELGDFAESIAFRAQEKGVELILDVKDVQHTQVISDPGRLRQILNNIVGNAIKFTAEGEILINCLLKPKNDTVARLFVSVKDSGIGIPQDKLSTLFEAFTQVDASTTRQYGGTGLGLSIVKKLTQLMNGSIRVESKPAEGSTFSFDIEVKLCENNSLVIPNVDVKGKRVLIIDDNPVNREVMREQLKHWDMKVTEAEDGIYALNILEKELQENNTLPYDIALVDMHMPHLDGAELGEKIRRVPAYDRMKLVMMTSLGSRGDAQRFAEIGFNAFFPKPTTTKDLFHALNVLIDDAESDKTGSFLTKDKLHTMHEEETSYKWPGDTRILLVEDNMTNQIVANGILETFDLQADVANDGQEALNTLKHSLKTKPYTLVLMDCQMPILDGYGASEAIRKGEAGEENINIPIVAMTANAMKGDKENCLAAGMDDYLTKPINPDTLEDMLIKWLKIESRSSTLSVLEPKSDNKILSWDKEEALIRLAGKESILKKVIEIYLDDSITQFEALEKAINEKAQDDVRLHAHSVKGSSANIGAQRLQEIASKMEESAKSIDLRNIASLFKEANIEVIELRKLLEAYLAQS